MLRSPIVSRFDLEPATAGFFAGGDNEMRSLVIAAVALALTTGAAGANDFTRVVKAEAAYINKTVGHPHLNLTVDVVYDKPGRTGKAWGTMSYLRPAKGAIPTSRIYANATCVGYFNSGNNISVVGEIARSAGAAASGWLVYEFDVLNQELRAITKPTLADARAACAAQSGTFQNTFNHGFFVFN